MRKRTVSPGPADLVLMALPWQKGHSCLASNSVSIKGIASWRHQYLAQINQLRLTSEPVRRVTQTGLGGVKFLSKSHETFGP